MHITEINSTQNRISFSSFKRTVYKAGRNAVDENILHRNNTWFFRGDLAWIPFTKNLGEKFKTADKVNTFVYACSDGREAYSLLIALDTILEQEEVKKFCPIIAKDYDLFVINQAKSNILEISDDEIEKINSITKNRFQEYFEPVSKIENRFKATKKLTDRITFETGDFTKEYQNLPKENVLLFVRNCWPYFSMTNQYNLPRKLCSHFDKNTIITLGLFDYNSQEENDFTHNGFKNNDCKNIYIK